MIGWWWMSLGQIYSSCLVSPFLSKPTDSNARTHLFLSFSLRPGPPRQSNRRQVSTRFFVSYRSSRVKPCSSFSLRLPHRARMGVVRRSHVLGSFDCSSLPSRLRAEYSSPMLQDPPRNRSSHQGTQGNRRAAERERRKPIQLA